MLKLLSVYGRSEQINNILASWGPGFSLVEKGVTDVEKEKARIHPVVLDWNWRYQRELLGLHIYRLFNMKIDTCVCVCTSVSYLCLLQGPRSKDIPIAVSY